MEGENHISDERLDAALKAYGAVESRGGLEQRILATLQAERALVTTRSVRWWPALGVAAAMLLLGAAGLLRTHRSTAPLANVKQPATRRAVNEIATVHGHDARRVQARPHQRENRAVAAVPKLEQFPSPQPLSEQEELLLRYIEQFPGEAVLVARAQTELTRQEMLERDLPSEEDAPTDSQQGNR